MDLVIDRKEWLRGEGVVRSYLLRLGDGKRCCVGIYARALGVPDKALSGCQWPGLSDNPPDKWEAKEDACSWLHHKGKCLMDRPDKSAGAQHLSAFNDDQIMTEADREEGIIAIFKRNGVNVTFTN